MWPVRKCAGTNTPSGDTTRRTTGRRSLSVSGTVFGSGKSRAFDIIFPMHIDNGCDRRAEAVPSMPTFEFWARSQDVRHHKNAGSTRLWRETLSFAPARSCQAAIGVAVDSTKTDSNRRQKQAPKCQGMRPYKRDGRRTEPESIMHGNGYYCT
jgi:hypothetical protein